MNAGTRQRKGPKEDFRPSDLRYDDFDGKDKYTHRFPPIPPLQGPLAPNNILSKAQRLYENDLRGPESIAINGDHLYTGTADGKIVDIYQGEIRTVAKLGKDPCGQFEDEPTCGRPLGMRIDANGYLIVCDGYLGLHKVNVATGDVHVLWPHTAPIEGEFAKFFNHLVIGDDEVIYFTVSSTKWDRRHNRYSILELEDTGRLVAYDTKRNITTVLVKGLSFPNGLEISRNGEFLIMAETARYRIWKYYLRGEKQGKLEVLLDNLPGLPDNIQRSSRGGYWVGFAAVRWSSLSKQTSVLDLFAPHPWLKKLLMKIFPQEILIFSLAKYGLVLEIDGNGRILRSLHDPSGETISAACDVADKDGVLYIGSYFSPYLGKVYLKKT